MGSHSQQQIPADLQDKASLCLAEVSVLLQQVLEVDQQQIQNYIKKSIDDIQLKGINETVFAPRENQVTEKLATYQLSLKHECKSPEQNCKESLCNLYYEERPLHSQCGGDVYVNVAKVDDNGNEVQPGYIPDITFKAFLIDGTTDIAKLPQSSADILMSLKLSSTNDQSLLSTNQKDRSQEDGTVITQCEGVLTPLRDLRVMQNSQSFFGRQDGTYRLVVCGKTSSKLVDIYPAISPTFQVNTRRSRCDAKSDGPALNDTLAKLKGIGGRFQKVLNDANFHTVQDFLDNLDVIKTKLPAKVYTSAAEHAQACASKPASLWLFPTHVECLGHCTLVYERTRGKLQIERPAGIVIHAATNPTYLHWAQMSVAPNMHVQLQEAHLRAVETYRSASAQQSSDAEQVERVLAMMGNLASDGQQGRFGLSPGGGRVGRPSDGGASDVMGSPYGMGSPVDYGRNGHVGAGGPSSAGIGMGNGVGAVSGGMAHDPVMLGVHSHVNNQNMVQGMQYGMETSAGMVGNQQQQYHMQYVQQQKQQQFQMQQQAAMQVPHHPITPQSKVNSFYSRRQQQPQIAPQQKQVPAQYGAPANGQWTLGSKAGQNWWYWQATTQDGLVRLLYRDNGGQPAVDAGPLEVKHREHWTPWRQDLFTHEVWAQLEVMHQQAVFSFRQQGGQALNGVSDGGVDLQAGQRQGLEYLPQQYGIK